MIGLVIILRIASVMEFRLFNVTHLAMLNFVQTVMLRCLVKNHHNGIVVVLFYLPVLAGVLVEVHPNYNVSVFLKRSLIPKMVLDHAVLQVDVQIILNQNAVVKSVDLSVKTHVL
jgi:hypothetical protein